jgi:hypothetical protein|tara:strand:+ start:133 stop:405 length:273 start_codon:yes stop_codon:yes gene_type:complete
MAVSTKIISGQDQPSGGGGIVGIAGARGLGSSGTLMVELGANNIVSPFPPLQPSQIDQSIAVIDARMDGRYSLKQAYDANQPSGVAIYPV